MPNAIRLRDLTPIMYHAPGIPATLTFDCPVHGTAHRAAARLALDDRVPSCWTANLIPTGHDPDEYDRLTLRGLITIKYAGESVCWLGFLVKGSLLPRA